jgi:aryl-alcohol dehydrogenase-like predicted oxidoreductase
MTTVRRASIFWSRQKARSSGSESRRSTSSSCTARTTTRRSRRRSRPSISSCARARSVTSAARISLLNRDYEWELLPLGRDQGVGAVVWSPLGWGKLTGKIRRGQPPQAGTRAHSIPETGPRYEEARLFKIVDALDALTKETGKTVPQIALNWLLRRPTVASLIVGARNEAQLLENIGAVGWKLTPEQVAKLDAASDVEPAYPVWHQRGFPQLNERAAQS